MEFEPDKPATPQDVALANKPRVNLLPVHAIEPDNVRIAPSYDRTSDISLESETESTAAAALSGAKLRDHPHHRAAVVAGVSASLLFGGLMTFLYINR